MGKITRKEYDLLRKLQDETYEKESAIWKLIGFHSDYYCRRIDDNDEANYTLRKEAERLEKLHDVLQFKLNGIDTNELT